MNEQKINELKEALRSVMMMIAERNQPLNEDLKLMLVRVMEHVANRIQELRNEGQVEGLTPPSAFKEPEIEQAMPSSNIYGFNYDYDDGKLLVKFQGNDGVGQGPVYAYEGVQPYIFNLFKKGASIAKTTGKNKWGEWFKGKSPSIGAAMHAFIKNGGYPYQKLA
jgi:hypothetical protein